jgi:hypothetical protein
MAKAGDGHACSLAASLRGDVNFAALSTTSIVVRGLLKFAVDFKDGSAAN